MEYLTIYGLLLIFGIAQTFILLLILDTLNERLPKPKTYENQNDKR